MPDKRPPKKRKSKPPKKKTVVTHAPASGDYTVVWLPAADAELKEIEEATEQVALRHAGEKLGVKGPQLGAPHSSSIKGSDGKGLRELRPRAGRSPWRAIYRQANAKSFVVLAVGPEAEQNKSGFNAAVKRARKRFEALAPDKEKQ